jgi:hypothetical protein
MMAIEFVPCGRPRYGGSLEARKAGVVIGVITENEGQYFFYKGADTKVGSNAVLRDADLERLKAAVQKLF